MTCRTIKQRKADPSGLTLAEVIRMADLLATSVETVLAAALADVQAARPGAYSVLVHFPVTFVCCSRPLRRNSMDALVKFGPKEAIRE